MVSSFLGFWLPEVGAEFGYLDTRARGFFFLSDDFTIGELGSLSWYGGFN